MDVKEEVGPPEAKLEVGVEGEMGVEPLVETDVICRRGTTLGGGDL